MRSAAVALRELDIGTLVIMDDGDMAGIVSERDVARALANGADVDAERVSDVMSQSPRYATTSDCVGTALEIMLAAGIRYLPVFAEGELVGIVSIRDLVAANAS